MTDWSKYKAPEKTDKWSAYKAVASELKKKENSDSTSEVPASESSGFRPAKTDFQVEPTIENFTVETEKREPTSLDYIANTSGSVIKSLIDFGVAYQDQVSFGSTSPIKSAIDQVQSQAASTRDWLKDYDANKAEDVAAFALGLVMDAPLFGAGGKIGKAASKPLINALKLLKNNAVKEGVEAFSAKQFTQNLAKKYAASVISNTASSATALGAYDSMVDFKNQIESGRDLEDIDWSENLKATSKGTLMGAALGPLAPSFGLASRYVNNTMSKGIAKSMANIGIKASEIPVEASVFSVLGKEKDQPLSWETYLDNVLMVGVMKGTGAIQKLRDLSKDQGSIYGVGLKPEESEIFKERGIESMESLDMQPAKIEELLQDKRIPLITKSKLLWRFAGVRADKLDMSPVNATISKDGEKSIVKVWNKDKELVDLQSYDNAEQAEGDALNVLRQADDLKLWQEASELTLQQKKRVTDKLGDLQEINQISLIPVLERTSADQKKVMSFRNAIEAIKKEDLEEAKSDVQSGGKTKSDTKLSPEKDNLSSTVKNEPTEQKIELNDTEKNIEQNIGEQENANEVKSTTSSDVGEASGDRGTLGEGNAEIPSGESKQAEAPQETLQETVGSLLEKETPKSSESGFMPFIAPLNIFDNPRAKRKAKDVVQILREQFLPSRGMPKEVHKEFMKTVGRINAKRYDIERSLKESKDELLKAYGDRLTDVQKEDIQKALENIGVSKTSSNIAFNTIASNVPLEARGVVEKMRNMIDSYSDDLKKLDMIGAGLEGKIDENTGYYVTRSYKKHTDRGWTWEKIPLKIKEDAANKLIDIFGITPDEALGMAKEMLETPDLTDYVIRKGNSIADIDKRSLQKRSQFLTDNVEIRALLGENRDPLYNYAVSLMRISEMAERGKMIENIRDLMSQSGLLSESPSYEKNHIAQIKYNEGLYKGRVGTKQLSEFYTTPEIAHAMNSFMDTGTPMGKAMKFYMKAITYTKISKTAGSVKGYPRNFKSNIFNAVGNGNWNIPQVLMYFNEVRKTKDSRIAFIRELKENTIIGDSANATEIMRNVEDMTNNMSKITRSDESFSEKAHRNVIGGMLKAYGFMDDVWKVFRYVSEKTRYKDAYVKNGMTEAEAEKKAIESVSEILHNTSTYYSQLPKAIQNLRKVPFANTFITFPYLTGANYLNTLQIAIKEINTPGLAHIGTQRLAGSVMGVIALAAISQFKNASNGVDDKDLEAYRRFLPKFWRNDDITIAEVKDNGVAEYNNSSYMDYYGVLTTPAMILRRRYRANGTITDEDLIDATKEFGSNFIGWDILFNALTEVKANQDDLGKPIYNPQEGWAKKYRDMTNYIVKNAFEPGTMTDAKRIYKTYREGGDWKRQMTGTLSGSQSRTLEPLKSLDFYMLPQYKDQIDNARKIYRTELKNFQRLTSPTEADQAKLAQAKERSESIMNSILGEITQDYNAAIRVGVKQEDLDKVVRGEKFDKDITNAILYRRGIGLDDLGAIVLQNQEWQE